MIEVEITNYESITHTKLKVEGFTTIIGRNYLGKSAVLRAINAALTNKEGTEFISWGQTFCEVRIKTADLDILWHKEEGNNFYTINGNTYSKIGKGEPPSEILDAGFKPIEVGDQKINLNYAVQFFPLFLVNKRDSKSADLLTSVYGLDRIYKAIDLCNKDQRATNDMLRIREKDLKIVEEGLKKFDTFPSIMDKLPELKKKRKEISEEEQKIETIKLKLESLKDLVKSTNQLKGITSIVLPLPGAIKDNIDQYQKLSDFQEDLNQYLTILKKLKPVQDISLPDNSVPEIKELFSEVQKVLIWDNSFGKLSEEVNRLTKIQEVISPDRYISEIKDSLAEYQKLLIWSSSLKKLSEEIKKLEKVKELELPKSDIEIEGIPALQQMFENAKTLAQTIQGLKIEIENIGKDIIAMETELKSYDVCPLCGAKRG